MRSTNDNNIGKEPRYCSFSGPDLLDTLDCKIDQWYASDDCNISTTPDVDTGPLRWRGFILKQSTATPPEPICCCPPYSGYNVVLTETNCADHFQAEVSFPFRKRFEQCDAKKSAQLDSEPDSSWHQHGQGNASVGVGFNNDNQRLLHGQTSPCSGVDKAGLCLHVMGNGKPYGIALIPRKQ